MGIIETILKIVALPLRIIISFALFTFIIIMLPQENNLALFLISILPTYKQWFLLSHILCDSIIFVFATIAIINKIKVSLQKKNKIKQEMKKHEIIDKKLNNLDHIEKAVLREYVIQGVATLNLPITQPAVASLVKNFILENVGQYCEKTIFGLMYNLKISEYADTRLTDEMLDLPNTETLTEADQKFIFNNRPHFIKNIQRLSRFL
jgi:hypothetical protein